MNLYEVLGIGRKASHEDIKRAYYKKAKLCHPDLTGGIETEAFRILTEAYEVLSDPKRREQYDETGVIGDSDPYEQQLQDQIIQVLYKILEMVKSPDENIIEKMKKSVREDINSLHSLQSDCKERSKRFKDIRSRIRGQDTFVNDLMLVRITQLENQIKEVDEEIKLMEDVLERIEDYTYVDEFGNPMSNRTLQRKELPESIKRILDLSVDPAIDRHGYFNDSGNW